MRNLFVKTYVAFAVLILISFTFAGSVFIVQTAKYSVQQTKQQLQTTTENLQALIENDPDMLVDEGERRTLGLYMEQLAQTSGSKVMTADASGRLLMVCDGQSGMQENIGGVLSDSLVARLTFRPQFFGLGTLNGLFSRDYYISGARCTSEDGGTIALIIAATPAEGTQSLLQNIMHSYLVIILFTLVLTLVISWFLSDILTRPLKSIVNAAKQFTRGDFDVRVQEDNNCDEIDELAVTFNNMVSTLQQQEALSRGFVANVSHELKTPMTSISGFADGMLDGTIPPEKYPQYLEIISQESHRLSRMVIRMLETARIESGEMVITPMPFDLSDTTVQVILSFENQLEEKQLDVDVDLEDYLLVNGDRDLIYRVIFNLVDNAVKFVDDKGTLTIRTEKAGKRGRFFIRNTGSTIPEEDLPHVFDRFYKVDRSRSMDRSGAGLGLYFVRSIVTLHGGDISVRSSGGATEFDFSIPLAPNSPNSKSNVPELTQNEHK